MRYRVLPPSVVERAHRYCYWLAPRIDPDRSRVGDGCSIVCEEDRKLPGH